MSFSIGAPEGWRQEDRPIQRIVNPRTCEWVMLPVVCRGEHLETCQPVDEGWICADDCPVEDMRTLCDYQTIVNELVRVDEDVRRVRRHIWCLTIPTLTVEWSVTRVSIEHRFKNGRRFASQQGDYSYDPYYRGTTRTKRRARRQLRKAIEEDVI